MRKLPVTLMKSVPYGHAVPKRREKASPTRNRATAPSAPPQATSRIGTTRATPPSTANPRLRRGLLRGDGRLDGRTRADPLVERAQLGPLRQVDADEPAPVEHGEQVRVRHGEAIAEKELPSGKLL